MILINDENLPHALSNPQAALEKDYKVWSDCVVLTQIIDVVQVQHDNKTVENTQSYTIKSH